MLDQLARAAPDAGVRLAHSGVEIGFHRGRIVVHAPSVASIAVVGRGKRVSALPHGTLEFASCTGPKANCARLHGAIVTVRTRAGGERIRLADDHRAGH